MIVCIVADCVGSVSAEGSEQCEECPVGSWNSIAGSSACEFCDVKSEYQSEEKTLCAYKDCVFGEGGQVFNLTDIGFGRVRYRGRKCQILPHHH